MWYQQKRDLSFSEKEREEEEEEEEGKGYGVTHWEQFHGHTHLPGRP